MPLPAKFLLEQKLRTLIHLDKSRFIDEWGIPSIVDQWHQRSGLDWNCLIKTVLAFDAAVFKPSGATGFGKCNNAFILHGSTSPSKFKQFCCSCAASPAGNHPDVKLLHQVRARDSI
jgi:hypothetical protein